MRLSALGDLVFCTALLDALHATWPQARIDWLAFSGFAGILAEDPRIDSLMTLPRDALRSPRDLWALRSRLRAQRYDWVIDAQGLAKSRLLAWLAGGRRRIGFASKEPLGFLMHEVFAKGGDMADIASEYRYLAEALTGRGDAPPPRLPVSEQAAARVAEAMHTHGLAPGFVALCPFTTRPQKHWFDAHWIALAEKLSADRLRCIILGGPTDHGHAQALCAAMPAGTLNLAGRTALRDLGAWLTNARLVVGVDTGLTHIGIAVQTPVVALFGSTRPYTGGAASPLAVLYEDMPCAPCKRTPTCHGQWTCMQRLSPARVHAAARGLLARSLAATQPETAS